MTVLRVGLPAPDVLEDPDLTGPILINFVFGVLLLLGSKPHFGDIYALFICGNLLSYFLYNFMSKVTHQLNSERANFSLSNHERNRIRRATNAFSCSHWCCFIPAQLVRRTTEPGNIHLVSNFGRTIHALTDEGRVHRKPKNPNHIPTLPLLCKFRDDRCILNLLFINKNNRTKRMKINLASYEF